MGLYGSASEVIRMALPILEDSETKRETLRGLLDQGEQSGLAYYSYEALISGLDDKSHK
jgi:antitoxin ParD1/3/4